MPSRRRSGHLRSTPVLAYCADLSWVYGRLYEADGENAKVELFLYVSDPNAASKIVLCATSRRDVVPWANIIMLDELPLYPNHGGGVVAGREETDPLPHLLPPNAPADLLHLCHFHDATVLHAVAGAWVAGCRIASVGKAVKLYLTPPTYMNDPLNTRRALIEQAFAYGTNRLANQPEDVEPDVLAMAEELYTKATRSNTNQSVCLAGDAGSGKRRVNAMLINALINVSGDKAGATSASRAVSSMLRQGLALLDVFGTAVSLTPGQDALRQARCYGRFVKLFFNSRGTLCGAKPHTYFLDPTRITQPTPAARSYDAFYQLLYNQEASKFFSLDPPEAYEYLGSGVYSLPHINDGANFATTMKAMEALGLKPSVRWAVWGVLAGILHISRIRFSAAEGIVHPQRIKFIRLAAFCWGINSGKLLELFTTPSAGSDAPVVPNAVKAEALRSLCEHVYIQLFRWLAEQCVTPPDADDEDGCVWIGVADFAGFEKSKPSTGPDDPPAPAGFAELKANLSCELLQHFSMHAMFDAPEARCASAGVPPPKVDHYVNTPLLSVCTGGMHRTQEEQTTARREPSIASSALRKMLDQSASNLFVGGVSGWDSGPTTRAYRGLVNALDDYGAQREPRYPEGMDAVDAAHNLVESLSEAVPPQQASMLAAYAAVDDRISARQERKERGDAIVNAFGLEGARPDPFAQNAPPPAMVVSHYAGNVEYAFAGPTMHVTPNPFHPTYFAPPATDGEGYAEDGRFGEVYKNATLPSTRRVAFLEDFVTQAVAIFRGAKDQLLPKLFAPTWHETRAGEGGHMARRGTGGDEEESDEPSDVASGSPQGSNTSPGLASRLGPGSTRPRRRGADAADDTADGGDKAKNNPESLCDIFARISKETKEVHARYAKPLVSGLAKTSLGVFPIPDSDEEDDISTGRRSTADLGDCANKSSVTVVYAAADADRQAPNSSMNRNIGRWGNRRRMSPTKRRYSLSPSRVAAGVASPPRTVAGTHAGSEADVASKPPGHDRRSALWRCTPDPLYDISAQCPQDDAPVERARSLKAATAPPSNAKLCDRRKGYPAHLQPDDPVPWYVPRPPPPTALRGGDRRRGGDKDTSHFLSAYTESLLDRTMPCLTKGSSARGSVVSVVTNARHLNVPGNRQSLSASARRRNRGLSGSRRQHFADGDGNLDASRRSLSPRGQRGRRHSSAHKDRSGDHLNASSVHGGDPLNDSAFDFTASEDCGPPPRTPDVPVPEHVDIEQFTGAWPPPMRVKGTVRRRKRVNYPPYLWGGWTGVPDFSDSEPDEAATEDAKDQTLRVSRMNATVSDDRKLLRTMQGGAGSAGAKAAEEVKDVKDSDAGEEGKEKEKSKPGPDRVFPYSDLLQLAERRAWTKDEMGRLARTGDGGHGSSVSVGHMRHDNLDVADASMSRVSTFAPESTVAGSRARRTSVAHTSHDRGLYAPPVVGEHHDVVAVFPRGVFGGMFDKLLGLFRHMDAESEVTWVTSINPSPAVPTTAAARGSTLDTALPGEMLANAFRMPSSNPPMLITRFDNVATAVQLERTQVLSLLLAHQKGFTDKINKRQFVGTYRALLGKHADHGRDGGDEDATVKATEPATSPRGSTGSALLVAQSCAGTDDVLDLGSVSHAHSVGRSAALLSMLYPPERLHGSCLRILEVAGLTTRTAGRGWVGTTHVFLQDGAKDVLERLRLRAMEAEAVVVQQFARWRLSHFEYHQAALRCNEAMIHDVAKRLASRQGLLHTQPIEVITLDAAKKLDMTDARHKQSLEKPSQVDPGVYVGELSGVKWGDSLLQGNTAHAKQQEEQETTRRLLEVAVASEWREMQGQYYDSQRAGAEEKLAKKRERDVQEHQLRMQQLHAQRMGAKKKQQQVDALTKAVASMHTHPLTLTNEDVVAGFPPSFRESPRASERRMGRAPSRSRSPPTDRPRAAWSDSDEDASPRAAVGFSKPKPLDLDAMSPGTAATEDEAAARAVAELGRRARVLEEEVTRRKHFEKKAMHHVDVATRSVKQKEQEQQEKLERFRCNEERRRRGAAGRSRTTLVRRTQNVDDKLHQVRQRRELMQQRDEQVARVRHRVAEQQREDVDMWRKLIGATTNLSEMSKMQTTHALHQAAKVKREAEQKVEAVAQETVRDNLMRDREVLTALAQETRVVDDALKRDEDVRHIVRTVEAGVLQQRERFIKNAFVDEAVQRVKQEKHLMQSSRKLAAHLLAPPSPSLPPRSDIAPSPNPNASTTDSPPPRRQAPITPNMYTRLLGTGGVAVGLLAAAEVHQNPDARMPMHIPTFKPSQWK